LFEDPCNYPFNFELVYLFVEDGFIFSVIHLQLSDLESSLLNLSDPQLKNVQHMLDDFDKKVLGHFWNNL